ncbi:MAG: hypothetical protein ABSH01_04110 [Terriglobia bacterium]|jgi:hypothetical protein
MTENQFEQAIALTRSLYNFAALHLIAEDKNGVWVNRYTSVTYGREQDLRSVPPVPGAKCEEQAGTRFLCLRQRLPRKDAEDFVARAIRGSVSIGAYTVTYDVEPAITGFRAASMRGDLADGSLWNSSGWSREHIGRVKEAGGYVLTRSTAWRIKDCVEFLRKVIWLPIPLREHPEKLGDLDEFWPAPIEFDVRGAKGSGTIEIVYDILHPEDHRLMICGSLIQDDLVWGHVCLRGTGPHPLPIDPDAVDLTLCVDGVPLDAKAHRFLSGVSMRFAVDTGPLTSYTVPEAGARPQMTFKVGSPELTERFVGKPPTSSVRHNAWVIGRIFRNPLRAVDAERFYDPVAIPDSVQRAFDDLRQLGTDHRRPRVLVADPYALDERALYAIGTIAARFGGVAFIEVASGFKAGDTDATPEKTRRFGEIWNAFMSWISRGRHRSAEEVTKRQETERIAFETAQRVAKILNIGFRFYRAERLHDRFLVVGDRVWHVGPSFNKIGEQVSAIVEMTDEKIRAQVLESLARFTAGPLLKEAKP